MPALLNALSADEAGAREVRSELEIGEESAGFVASEQKPLSWVAFFAILSAVAAAAPTAASGISVYLQAMDGVSSNSTFVMLLLLFVFGASHSGMAALRPKAEAIVGPRAYRVSFALVSLPLAAATVFYYIGHRYDGGQLFSLQGVPGVHELVWILSLLSFYFLYPSTFNLLEVAAVDVPKVHLWETGVIRITRHPQMVGQLIWSLAHCLWIGTPFSIVTNMGLVGYHMFACWHGDKRLRDAFGDEFSKLEERTSVWPFAAIVQGRQKLPPDYWKEWARAPYITVTVFAIGAYLCHPLMQRAAYWLNDYQ